MRCELPVVPLCTGCGKCCEHIGLPPFEVANPDLGAVPVRPTDWVRADQSLRDMDTFAAMPAELRAEHAKMVSDYEGSPSDRPCAWLDPATKDCRHYEHRPAVCRDWAPGGDGCRAALRGARVTWRTATDRPDDYWNPRHGDPDPPAVTYPWDRETNVVLAWLRRLWRRFARRDGPRVCCPDDGPDETKDF